MSDLTWVHGIGDTLVRKLVYWINNYDKGTICATRKFMTKPGELGLGPQVIDKPTAKSVVVPWNQIELEYLIQVLDIKHPTWPVTLGLKSDLKKWRMGRLLPGGEREIEMALYPEALIEIFKTVIEVRDGKKETSGTSDVDFDSILSKDSGIRS